MCEWRSTRFGDICEHSAFGPRFSGKSYDEDGSVATLRTTDIAEDGRIDYSTMPRADLEHARFGHHFLRAGDLVISRSGRIGTTAVFEGYDSPVLPGAFLLRFRLKRDVAEPSFYRYYFNSLLGQTSIRSIATGSVQQNIKISSMHELLVPVPSLQTQRHIAHILGTLDDKIELNRRMNRTLETIARAIFKSWFIDFDPVIDNALAAGKPIPEELRNRAEIRTGQNQPSPPAPLPEVEGRSYRGGFEFAGLVEKARELRQKQTPVEEIMWEVLRDRRFLDLKFRHQHQIGDYIADFYCHDHKLVIELDGGIHRTQEAKDAKRNAYMESLGLTVLRFPNDEVLNSPENVLSQIAEAVGVSPSPSGRGGGDGAADQSPSTFGRGVRGEGVAGYRHLFPDSFEDSPLGKIPQGWVVRAVASLCERIENGGTPKRKVEEFWNGGIPWYKTGELVDAPLIRSSETISALGLQDSSCKLWPSGTILIALYASPTVGHLGLLTEPSAANQACSALIANDPCDVEFLFHSLLHTRGQLQRFAVGAAQQNISQKVVREHILVRPTASLVRIFNTRVSRFRELQILLLKQSAVLSRTRDSLLPKFLSGQIATLVAGTDIGRLHGN